MSKIMTRFNKHSGTVGTPSKVAFPIFMGETREAGALFEGAGAKAAGAGQKYVKR